MTLDRDKAWWTILPSYAVGGLALGLADFAAGRVIQQFGTKPGLVTALSVNVVMPLIAVGLAWARPSLRSAWLGAFGMGTAFLIGLGTVHTRVDPWDVAAWASAVRPVIVLACLGYAVIGSLVVIARRAFGAASPRVENG